MTHERPLPPIPLPRAAVVVLLFAAFAAVVVWLFRDHDLFLPFALFGAIALASFFYYRRRCPQCGGRLVFRRDYIAGTRRFRCLHDCHRCDIAWDRREVGDDDIT